MSAPPTPRRIVGIDLGTTNSAVAWCEQGASPAPPRLFSVSQLVAPGEIAARGALPSFLYLPTPEEYETGALALPWDARPDAVAGAFARDHGALVPTRQVSSAKSWLSNPFVDRRARLLPFGAEDGAKLSPVDASARLLRHLRDAWNHEHGDALRLEHQAIVLTVPASFDEEARELTVEAAQAAGLTNLTLLEEPLAAVYALIAQDPQALRARLAADQVLLVCDVGGGTADFTLLRASAADGGGVEFERTATGDHLLLGGDNVDLALAARLERKLTALRPGSALSLTQRLSLRRHASGAKERLLGSGAPPRIEITVLGSGHRVVGGALTVELSRAEVLDTLAEFLPVSASDDRLQRHRRHGLRELGLPYEDDPAVTRHLADFLARAGNTGAATSGAGLARPDAILFNGGFFTPAIARERVLDALESWFGRRPAVFPNEAPDAAVAVGAAFYGALRSLTPPHRAGLLIRAGSARSYYIGVQSSSGPAAVCVMPKGTQEGTRLELQREFTVTTNQPAAFTLWSAFQGEDALGTVVTLRDDEAHRHAPLVAALRYGQQRSRKIPIGVRLAVIFTEVGTLEIWCESLSTEHRWRLQFNLRGAESPGTRDAPTEAQVPAESRGMTQSQAATSDTASANAAEPSIARPEAAEVVVSEDSIASAEDLVRSTFTGPSAPEMLIGALESALRYGKQSWPLPVLRRLADVLLQLADGRRVSPRHEARWLNLTGFCMRPGFGAAVDPWRIGEMRKVYAAGLAFPKDIQCQVEWLILWQRVSGGFTNTQQQELASRLIGMLGLGTRKVPRLNAQVLREAWRLLGGLERLDRAQRVKLGDELVGKVRREPQNGSYAWALARFGARIPLYGPLNSVVPAAAAERWLDAVLELKALNPELVSTVVEIAAMTGDPARDVSEGARQAALARLEGEPAPADALRRLKEPTALSHSASARLFGESLPEGLRIQ